MSETIESTDALGDEWPDIVIVGCGKVSDGEKWEPFAARLDTASMTYHRLDRQDFDLAEWARKMADPKRRAMTVITPEKVIQFVQEKVGKGMIKARREADDGLIKRVMSQFSVSRDVASEAVIAAEQLGLRRVKITNPKNGGYAMFYTLDDSTECGVGGNSIT